MIKIVIRLPVPHVRLPWVRLDRTEFANPGERRAAYERLFFGSADGVRVLADILTANGTNKPSFPAAGFDALRAASCDGAKACALDILEQAGGNPDRLERAFVINNLLETHNDHRNDIDRDDDDDTQ